MRSEVTIAGDQLQAALSLARQGIPVGPLRSKPETLKNGKSRPAKSPKIADFPAHVTTDETEIRRMWKKWPDAMPGTATGPASGLAVLDLDQKDGKDGIAELRALGFDPYALSPCVVETPSGGLHLYFRWSEGLGCSAAGLPLGVDVRGQGGVIALPGAVNGKGTYRLRSGALKAEELPEWPEGLRPRWTATEGASGEPTGLPTSVTLGALAACPNDGDAYPSRESWVRMGMAVHCETDGSEEGREAWHDWSAQHPTYDRDDTDAAWDSFGRGRGAMVTGWHIIREAQRHGWHDPAVTELEHMASFEAALAESEPGDWREGLDAEALFLLGQGPDPNANDLVMLTPDQCALAEPQPYVVKGMIARGNVVSVVGAPGVGKSVLAPYLAYAVAQGRQVFGMRTNPGKVFYFPAENESDMQLRIRALRQEHGPADNFRLVMGGGGALKDAAFMRKVRAAIKRERPSMIVVDTLAAAMPGFDENSSEGMGEAIALVRSLTRWGAAVLIVHHDTKAGDGKPRGHSSLHGIVDMNLALELSTDGDVTGTPSKNRNGPSHRSMLAYSIRRVTMGTDADGDDIATVVCEEGEASAMRPRKGLTPSATAALALLAELGEGGRVSEDDWREAAISGRAVSAAEEKDSRRRAFKRAVEELLRTGSVHFQDGFYSTGNSVEEMFTDDMV